MLFIEEVSKRNSKLVKELIKREFEARENDDLKEAQFLMRVRHRVELGVAMEHDESTVDICPHCQLHMSVKHGVYCQSCGQLVK